MESDDTNIVIGAIKKKILPILRRFGVRRAGLFGSILRGEASAESDLDVLVEIAPEASLFDLIALKLDLEEELGMKVDIVEYSAVKPQLRERILQEQAQVM